MLRVLFLFLVVIASVVLGPMLAGHQGYVLIRPTITILKPASPAW